MVQTERRLSWHPRLDNRFLVGGGGQLSLYEWCSDPSEIKPVTSKHDLQMMKVRAIVIHSVQLTPHIHILITSVSRGPQK